MTDEDKNTEKEEVSTVSARVVDRKSKTDRSNKDKSKNKFTTKGGIKAQEDVLTDSEESEYDDSDDEGNVNPCGTCQEPVLKDHKALYCDICTTWYHIQCMGVNTKKFTFLKQNEDIHWYCDQCNRAAKSLHQEIVSVKMENAQLKQDLTALEDKFTDFQTNAKKIA